MSRLKKFEPPRVEDYYSLFFGWHELVNVVKKNDREVVESQGEISWDTEMPNHIASLYHIVILKRIELLNICLWLCIGLNGNGIMMMVEIARMPWIYKGKEHGWKQVDGWEGCKA